MAKTEYRNRADKSQKSQQGAAMMAVMLILLLATATAAVTIESTGFEAKASGYNRMAAQVKNISESGLVTAVALSDRVGAQSLKIAMQTDYAAKLAAFNANTPSGEPPMHEGGFFYRVSYDDYSDANKPMSSEDAIGPKQGHAVDFSVDIYDAYVSTRAVPGYTVDGRPGSVQFLELTYIARGRMRFNDQTQIEHVACACVEAGPF